MPKELTEAEFNEHLARFNGAPGSTKGLSNSELSAMLVYADTHEGVAKATQLDVWIEAHKSEGHWPPA